MKHFLFSGNESPEEIKRILLDNCSGRDTTTFHRRLTEDEIKERSELLVDNMLSVSKADQELADAKEEHKNTVKPLLAANKTLLHELKSKHAEVEGTLYLLPNFESGMMEFVDENGDIIHTRKLKPDERQGNIIHMARAVGQ